MMCGGESCLFNNNALFRRAVRRSRNYHSHGAAASAHVRGIQGAGSAANHPRARPCARPARSAPAVCAVPHRPSSRRPARFNTAAARSTSSRV
jgi:hypothetical protein